MINAPTLFDIIEEEVMVEIEEERFKIRVEDPTRRIGLLINESVSNLVHKHLYHAFPPTTSKRYIFTEPADRTEHCVTRFNCNNKTKILSSLNFIFIPFPRGTNPITPIPIIHFFEARISDHSFFLHMTPSLAISSTMSTILRRISMEDGFSSSSSSAAWTISSVPLWICQSNNLKIIFDYHFYFKVTFMLSKSESICVVNQ